MAIAQSNSYSITSGQEMFVGVHKPSWLPQTGFYAEIPLAQKLSVIDPELDPLINPNHPGSAPWRGTGGVAARFSAWCGDAYDYVNDRILSGLDGGHEDYAGNEIYNTSLRADSPSIVMPRPPTGAIGNTGVLDDGQEASGVYFDGRPRTTHSYNKQTYVPTIDKLVMGSQGSTYRSGQAGTTDTLIYDLTTGEAERITGDSQGGNATDYDPSRDCIWQRTRGLATLAKFDVKSKTWTTHGAQKNDTGGTLSITYIPNHDILFIINNISTHKFWIFDCASEIYYEPALSGSLVGMVLNGDCQPRYVEDGDYLALWNNSTNTTSINKIAVPANPLTDAWVVSQIPVDAGNTVTPSAAQANGTYGRFFYSPILGGFGMWNAANENPYFFKVR